MKTIKKRTLFRWLTQELGMCKSFSKRYAGMTPERAWDKAPNNEKYRVMVQVGIPHNEKSCPYCNENARAAKVLPARVLRAFRKWQAR